MTGWKNKGTRKMTQPTTTEILTNTKLEELVKEYQLKGKCPFCDHPAFTVNTKRQTWTCSECRLSGNAIRFVERIHSTTYKQAVELLARRAGLLR